MAAAAACPICNTDGLTLIACPGDQCPGAACVDCWQTWVMTNPTAPRCTEGRCDVSMDFIRKELGAKFYNTKYREMREEQLFAREMLLMPQLQPVTADFLELLGAARGIKSEADRKAMEQRATEELEAARRVVQEKAQARRRVQDIGRVWAKLRGLSEGGSSGGGDGDGEQLNNDAINAMFTMVVSRMPREVAAEAGVVGLVVRGSRTSNTPYERMPLQADDTGDDDGGELRDAQRRRRPDVACPNPKCRGFLTSGAVEAEVRRSGVRSIHHQCIAVVSCMPCIAVLGAQGSAPAPAPAPAEVRRKPCCPAHRARGACSWGAFAHAARAGRQRGSRPHQEDVHLRAVQVARVHALL